MNGREKESTQHTLLALTPVNIASTRANIKRWLFQANMCNNLCILIKIKQARVCAMNGLGCPYLYYKWMWYGDGDGRVCGVGTASIGFRCLNSSNKGQRFQWIQMSICIRSRIRCVQIQLLSKMCFTWSSPIGKFICASSTFGRAIFNIGMLTGQRIYHSFINISHSHSHSHLYLHLPFCFLCMFFFLFVINSRIQQTRFATAMIFAFCRVKKDITRNDGRKKPHRINTSDEKSERKKKCK